MLQFAKGVPLGEKGLDWLKIHLVTLHGAKKKSSLQERLNYADEIMDDVLDSADNPLTVNCVTSERFQTVCISQNRLKMCELAIFRSFCFW